VATPISQDRSTARRRATIEEALTHAQALIAEQGAGAATVSEIARRLGMRAPSLYKYFPSRHAIYDALFARGNAQVAAFIDGAVRDVEPGLERLLQASRAAVRWTVSEPGLAPLLFWRPVPGFTPSPEAFAPAAAMWQRYRSDLTTAVLRGQLRAAADSDEVLRILTIIIAGICSQQMANGPSASYDDGAFTSLTDRALDMFINNYR
jgi:AcrR family transcriptional regulator